MEEKILDIYIEPHLIGQLAQDSSGLLTFRYSTSWLQQDGAYAISESLLLRADSYQESKCRTYFAGILPEENARELIAKIFGISARNDYALLNEIGGECAGALMFLPHGTLPLEVQPVYKPITSHELESFLRELPRRPLLAKTEGVRLSLAGAQNKLALKISEGSFSLPLYNAPSTHIIKPEPERFPQLVANEAFCMMLAAAIKLPVPRVEIGRAGTQKYLAIERYDRKVQSDGEIVR
jgi:serine/threonine-protein kinase HipA